MISEQASNPIDNPVQLDLDDAMLKHVRHIVLTEHRPFSYPIKSKNYAVVRREIQERPNMSFKDALKEKLKGEI
jgi:hypothetical protein